MSELTHRGLLRRLTRLQQDATHVSELMTERAKAHRVVAEDTASVAESISAMGIDSATVQECGQLADLIAAVGEAQTQFASACADLPALAEAAVDTAKKTDGRIQEAFDASPVDASHVDREFFRQI